MVQEFLIQYWGLIVCFLAGVIYVLTHRQASLTFAKKRAIELMFYVEKQAESMALEQGKDKLKWVTENGYDLLPAAVRVFVSKPMFQIIVQEVFDTIIGLAEKHRIDSPVEPVQPEPIPVPVEPLTPVDSIQASAK
jgi:hypothetical protein